MGLNLKRMLKKCRKEQWALTDLDWTTSPRSMSRDEEEAVVQLFTDMAAIERLAGALFEEQRRRTDDPVLKEIFESFVVDEVRHSHVAQMLADHYDVNKYRLYQENPHLRRFAPHFVHAVRFLSADMANVYITTGELILDVALLRSLNDYVDDTMSQVAMDKINRDESRHIAIDYYMTEFYASDEYVAWLNEQPRAPLGTQLKAWWAFANVLHHARPFFRDVFFAPMERVDPTGKRIKEAFKRIQLLASKDGVRERPFPKFVLTLQAVFNHPVGRVVFGRVISRVLGVTPEVIMRLYTEEEFDRARRMSFEDLAAEALNLKHA
jgi:hypothetical protein